MTAKKEIPPKCTRVFLVFSPPVVFSIRFLSSCAMCSVFSEDWCHWISTEGMLALKINKAEARYDTHFAWCSIRNFFYRISFGWTSETYLHRHPVTLFYDRLWRFFKCVRCAAFVWIWNVQMIFLWSVLFLCTSFRGWQFPEYKQPLESPPLVVVFICIFVKMQIQNPY